MKIDGKALMWFPFVITTFSLVISIVQSGCYLDKEDLKLVCSSSISYETDQMASNTTSIEIVKLELYNMKLGELHDAVSNISRILPNIKINLKFLKVANCSIAAFGSQMYLLLKALDLLDLSANNIQSIPEDLAPYLNRVRAVYLTGNKWNCSMDLEWVLKLNASTVRDLKNLTCHGTPYGGKPLLFIANMLHNIRSQCTKECTCSLPNVVQDPESLTLQPIIEVDCSDAELLTLPEQLPQDTKILHLERNWITDLKPLAKNPIYRSVQDLYLEENRVKSISNLEGSYWLSHFRVLSLADNKLTELPTYALDNALQQNPNMPNAVRIYFGDNPWRCDCVFTPSFQDMLRKYEDIIQDINEVQCSYVEGDENSLVPILDVSRTSVCRLPAEYSVRALDLLNGTLASLIVLILGKLAYDYYNFKKTGRLPWIVTKMP